MIRFICPRCKKNCKAPAEAAGKHAICPRCGIHLRVPTLNAPVGSSSSPNEPVQVSHLVGRSLESPAAPLPAAGLPFDQVAKVRSQNPWPWVAVGGTGFLLLLTLLAISSRSESARLREQLTTADREANETIQGLRKDRAALEKQVRELLPKREVSLRTENSSANITARLVRLEKCYEYASSRSWGRSIQQIPATVIDKGVLKYVPYQSFKCGDYEINIYGDPDLPACLEIGVRNDLLRNQEAKNNCVEFIQATLTQSDDRAFLLSLRREKDSKKRQGLTFEITPETDEDAYGGWWVSVYDEKLLDESRASEKELMLIALSRDEIKSAPQASKDDKQGPRSTERPYSSRPIDFFKGWHV